MYDKAPGLPKEHIDTLPFQNHDGNDDDAYNYYDCNNDPVGAGGGRCPCTTNCPGKPLTLVSTARLLWSRIIMAVYKIASGCSGGTPARMGIACKSSHFRCIHSEKYCVKLDLRLNPLVSIVLFRPFRNLLRFTHQQCNSNLPKGPD